MANGNISATRIEKKPAGQQLEVHGIVSGLDTVNFKFSINALVVDYASATLDDFANGMISEGDPVEAKGAALAANGVSSTRVSPDPPSH